MSPDLIRAIQDLFKEVVATFGPSGTIGLLAGIAALITIRRLYLDHRKDNEVNLALAQMEKAVQRAANEAREYRILIFKEKFGWTDEQVERFFVAEEYEDARVSRMSLRDRVLTRRWLATATSEEEVSNDST
jgi:hypothetical protein